MTLQKRSYTTGFFEMAIDGQKTTAYLKSVEGGFAKANNVDDPIGPLNERVKHNTTVDIEPITVEFGLANADHILEWIQKSWRKKYTRYNGQITHADFNLNAQFEQEFMRCLILETTFPTLDGSSKDAGYLKCKIQPEQVTQRKTSSGKIQAHFTGKQKLWLPSNFRFNIDGVDDFRHTNKLDGFTVKQGVKKFYVGEERFPTIEPTKIEFPNLSGTISLAHADGVLRWFDQVVMKGGKDSKHQKTGSIEFLSPDLKKTIFAIQLFEVGITSCQIQQSQANGDQIKRVKFDLFVGRMELDGKFGWG